MATIPTIADVLDGLVAGRYTRAQALVWIDLLIGEACDASCDRDAAARAAMQTLLADRKFVQDAINARQNPMDAVACEAYRAADSMKKARSA
jgi:hypothetical protein